MAKSFYAQLPVFVLHFSALCSVSVLFKAILSVSLSAHMMVCTGEGSYFLRCFSVLFNAKLSFVLSTHTMVRSGGPIYCAAQRLIQYEIEFRAEHTHDGVRRCSAASHGSPLQRHPLQQWRRQRGPP